MPNYPTIELQPGSTDINSVKQLQDYLVSIGKMTKEQVDTGYGIYGKKTTAAVLALQKELGIDYSSGPGYWGPKTLAALTASTSTPTKEQIPTPPPIQEQTPTSSYEIESGDTLSEIAVKNGISLDELMAANPQITDPNKIYSGSSLNIPTKQTATPPPVPTNEISDEWRVFKTDQYGTPMYLSGFSDQESAERYVNKFGGKIIPPASDIATAQPVVPPNKDIATAQPVIPPITVPKTSPTQLSDISPSNLETSLMNTYGWNIEQVRDPSFIKNKITEITGKIQTLQNQKEKEDAILEFVKMAAGAGIPFADIKDYMSSLTTPTKSQEEITQEIYKKYGIEDLELKAFATPVETFEQIYTRVISDSKVYVSGQEKSLTEAKTELSAIQSEIDKATADYNTAVGDVNANPWKSEAGRVGSIAKATDAYDKTLTRLQAKQTVLANSIERAENKATNLSQTILSEAKQGQQLTQEELSYYTTRAKADIEAQTTLQKETENKELYRYYPEYTAAMPEKTMATNTQVIEVNGRKLLIDSKTGTTIKDLGETGGDTETESNLKAAIDAQLKDYNAFGVDKKVSWETYLWMYQNWINNGGSKQSFDANYPIGQYLDENNQSEFNSRIKGF